jgi:hypothetical protein
LKNSSHTYLEIIICANSRVLAGTPGKRKPSSGGETTMTGPKSEISAAFCISACLGLTPAHDAFRAPTITMILRRWYRIIAGVFLLLSLDETALAVRAATSVTQTTGDEEECTLSHACQMCTFSDKKEIPECIPTGRRQTFTCIIDDGGKCKNINVNPSPRKDGVFVQNSDSDACFLISLECYPRRQGD